MVGGTSFPPHDSKSEPWSNEQKTKATPKPSTKGKAKPEARTLAGRGIATGALEVSLDNADTVIEGAPGFAPRFWAPFQFSLDLRRHGVRRLKQRNHNQDRENVNPAQAVEILTYLKSRL
jgi:hypothetical protein